MLSSMLGSLENMGKTTLAYRMSKSSVNAMTRVFAAELADDKIRVNSICPGWVRTELGGSDAPVTPQQGAQAVVDLALKENTSGAFFREGIHYPW